MEGSQRTENRAQLGVSHGRGGVHSPPHPAHEARGRVCPEKEQKQGQVAECLCSKCLSQLPPRKTHPKPSGSHTNASPCVQTALRTWQSPLPSTGLLLGSPGLAMGGLTPPQASRAPEGVLTAEAKVYGEAPCVSLSHPRTLRPRPSHGAAWSWAGG